MIYVVWLRQSPRAHWRLNLTEARRERAEYLAQKWRSDYVKLGYNTAEAAITQCEWTGGDIAKLEARGGKTLLDTVVATFKEE